ncbi:Uncharacterised protein [Salmonella enterica subsp. enterica]|uniref:Uncharacterized protein n=1 Tax=Salmonella enterica I TaxID=59201 RepID=A0A3S4HWC3_SALET|nr:Uncharacterised protein [Salmonella enterica subsp. enterica]
MSPAIKKDGAGRHHWSNIDGGKSTAHGVLQTDHNNRINRQDDGYHFFREAAIGNDP